MEVLKHKNRKLYSRTLKRYVTLEDIKQAVQEGRAVTVVNHMGQDITAKTLSKVAALIDATAIAFEEFISNH